MLSLKRPITRSLGFLLSPCFATALLLCGCATNLNSIDSDSRFHEEVFTDLVIQYYNWDSMEVLKPKARDGGFLRRFQKDSISRFLEDFKVRYGMAVVRVAGRESDQALKKIYSEWETLLRQNGFNRVVFLRASMKDGINGQEVLYDSGATTNQ